jgi:gliding motility-associated-like protein
LCRGANITVHGNYSSIGNTDFVWYFGNGDSLHNVNPVIYAYSTIGSYNITATARYRVCPTVTTTIPVFVATMPTVNLGLDTVICEGSSAITLADTRNALDPAASWLWNTGETTSSITAATQGLYYVTVNVGGCAASDSIMILDDCSLTLPRTFTPNGDGINDFFNPRDWVRRGLKSFKLQIFNRWGQLIFETTSVEGRGWDGRFNETDQPTGAYIFNIEGIFVDGQRMNKKGNITLLR